MATLQAYHVLVRHLAGTAVLVIAALTQQALGDWFRQNRCRSIDARVGGV
ncbi:MAG TPA: hypothetical protein VGW38_23395 [Chloroflexota bacterium]|nr:hypothetical protein [Chloroflexota bacterium]